MTKKQAQEWIHINKTYSICFDNFNLYIWYSDYYQKWKGEMSLPGCVFLEFEMMAKTVEEAKYNALQRAKEHLSTLTSNIDLCLEQQRLSPG